MDGCSRRRCGPRFRVWSRPKGMRRRRRWRHCRLTNSTVCYALRSGNRSPLAILVMIVFGCDRDKKGRKKSKSPGRSSTASSSASSPSSSSNSSSSSSTSSPSSSPSAAVYSTAFALSLAAWLLKHAQPTPSSSSSSSSSWSSSPVTALSLSLATTLRDALATALQSSAVNCSSLGVGTEARVVWLVLVYGRSRRYGLS